MSGLTLRNINKTYPEGHQIIRDFELELTQGEFLILAGPEGCGKSTLLRIIAGFEELSGGEILIDGKDVTDADPRDRNLAMLFRNSVLYPSLTVAENLTLSLRLLRTAPGEAEKRLRETAEFLELGPVLDKTPDQLTKEETVRALLGRALVRRPGLLLVDSGLDGLGAEIQRCLSESGITVIYADDSGEIPKGFGTRLVLMNDGMICQDGAPGDVYREPASLFAARYFSHPMLNLTSATVFGEENRVGLSFTETRLMLPDETGRKLAKSGFFGKEVLFAVRPEAIRPAKKNEGEAVEALLQGMELYENRPLLHFSAGTLVGTAFADGMPACGVHGRLRLAVDMEQAFIFDPETEKSLII